VGISTFVAILLITGLSLSFSFFVVRAQQETMAIELQIAIAIITLVTVALQYLCFFRHGMARYALYGALLNWTIFSVLAIFVSWLGEQNSKNQESSVIAALAAVFLLLIVCGLYAAMGVVASVMGAYWRLRRSDARKDRLSRQELLERLFEIEERIRIGPSESEPEPGILDHPVLLKIGRRSTLSALALGSGLGLIRVLVIGALLHWYPQQTEASYSYMILTIVIWLAWLLGVVSVAFVGHRFIKALLSSLAFALGFTIAHLIPFGNFGLEYVLIRFPWFYSFLFVLIVSICYIACLGARVEDRASQERRLRHNDPATLLSELLDIQFLLTPTTAEVCVMVVDAARSAEMKAAADPFVVEYSFRMYQRMLRDTSGKLGGTVHSTAGDGAVIAFPNCTEAFAAAKRIQTDIDGFNRDINRLRSPFRLRIGLHVGKVQGDIDKVQFTEVIDIAAHVQDVAPVGGIAMTEEVAAQLEGEAVVQLKDAVDGHMVMLVLNPTLDQ
jgi:class 3 adenylate cyclase